MYLRFIAVIVCIFLSSPPLYGDQVTEQDWIFLSIPKSGSHLVGKLFLLFRELKKTSSKVPGGHLYYSNSPSGMNTEVELVYKTKKKLILLRDPRDIIVSAAFWFTKQHSEIKEWSQLTFDEKLTVLIKEEMDPPFRFLSDSIRMLDVYINAGPEYCVIKFEKLIGLKGGGILDDQIREINKIADFFSFEITPKEMEYICEELHGLREADKIGVQTFRSGQIGDWKKYFKPHHIALFNEKFGKSMKALGYE